MEEFLLNLKECIVEILISIKIIVDILIKPTTYTKTEKLQIKQQKAHKNSLKQEKKLAKAYEKEKNLDNEVKMYDKSI